MTGVIQTVAQIAWLADVIGTGRGAVEMPQGEEETLATVPHGGTGLSPPQTEEEGFIPVPRAESVEPEPGEIMAAEAPPSRIQLRKMATLLCE